ncbi:MAG: stage V sporulation protein AD [bacterium]|nr:stage V sporulation protein AD [bacterium]
MTYYFNNVYIKDKYSLLASDKYTPIVLNDVDYFKNDYYMGQKCVELCESKYQEIVIDGLLEKTKITNDKIDILINGDLQNQILSSTLASNKFLIPTLGIYSACASFIEGMVIGSMFINGRSNSNVIVSSSSHNLVSEKQFRFPIEYGALRKRTNTLTASGSVAVLLNNTKSKIKIESATIGSVITTNHKDTNDMGSAMASACSETLIKHLKETKRKSNYYDLILTGDLGIYGIEIVKEYYNDVTKEKLNNIIDSGSIFYNEDNIFAGASGPVCLPLVLFDYILKQKQYKKILVIGTGSLHSVISTNLKLPIPSIAHAISLEVSN